MDVLNTAAVRVADPILSTLARGWSSPQNVGAALFPHVATPTLGGKIISFGDEALRRYDTVRAPGARVAEIQFGYAGAEYALEMHDLDAAVPREWLTEAQRVPAIDLAGRAINTVMRAMALEQEVTQATLATTPGNYAAAHSKALSGDAKWSHANSNPSQAVADAFEKVRSAVGHYPTVGIIGAAVFSELKFHQKLLENVKYTSKDSVSLEQLRALWDLRELHIGQAIVRHGRVTRDVWGQNAIFAYVPEPGQAQMENLSFGYTYVLQGHPIVETPAWDRATRSWHYGVSYHYKPVIAGNSSGYLLTGVV